MSAYKTVGIKSVLTAVLGKFSVAVLKLIGFLASGSAVMLSECIHSVADTANQSLMLIGIKRSERPADERFNYGYKQERFFWALVSACGIFFLGAGITLYHGVNSLLHPHPAHFNEWLLVILFFSFLFEGYALFTALKEVRHHARGKGKLYKYIKQSADPTILAVIYEDSAALIGILFASISIILTKITGFYFWDGVGSILVGLLLGVVAIILIKTNRDFLMSKAIPPHIQNEISAIIKKHKIVESVHDFKTAVLSTDGYRIKAEIEIEGSVLAQKIFETRDFRREYGNLRTYQDFVKFCADYTDEVTRTLGKEIDKLEKEIAEKIPTAKYIDLEAN